MELASELAELMGELDGVKAERDGAQEELAGAQAEWKQALRGLKDTVGAVEGLAAQRQTEFQASVDAANAEMEAQRGKVGVLEEEAVALKAELATELSVANAAGSCIPCTIQTEEVVAALERQLGVQTELHRLAASSCSASEEVVAALSAKVSSLEAQVVEQVSLASAQQIMKQGEHSQEAAFNELVHENLTLKSEKEALGLQIQRTVSWARKEDLEECPLMSAAVGSPKQGGGSRPTLPLATRR